MSHKVEWERKYRSDGGTLWWEDPYVNGVLHGVAKEYRQDGTTCWCETPYVDGQLHGVERRYLDDDNLYWERYWVYGIARDDLTPLAKLVLFGEEA